MDAPVTLAPDPDTDASVTTLVELLRERTFLALTGAGISTDSGIPDYRGPGSVDRAPMTYQEFVSGGAAQQRYWARSFLGWERMGGAAPNPGHHALARLEAAGLCTGVVTQNVDGLHERAGTSRVVALHGRIADVTCLGCGQRSSRSALQHRLAEANPTWSARHAEAPVRPDGDVEVAETADFTAPRCTSCDGVLKPDVVFFGENVPKPRVELCYDLVDAAIARGGALLVLGSSLTVMSGFRFVRHAAKHGLPVVIVNRGRTRGDEHATHRVEVGTTQFLTAPAWLDASSPPL